MPLHYAFFFVAERGWVEGKSDYIGYIHIFIGTRDELFLSE
jgi:hypothetical protein